MITWRVLYVTNNCTIMNNSNKSKPIDQDNIITVPKPKCISNKEHFQRLNYLLQLSKYNTIFNNRDVNDGLTRSYLKNITLIQKKTKINLTTGFKRNICKKCFRLQIPTITTEPFIENLSKFGRVNTKANVLVCRCRCGKLNRFPIGQNPEYKTFSEINITEINE